MDFQFGAEPFPGSYDVSHTCGIDQYHGHGLASGDGRSGGAPVDLRADRKTENLTGVMGITLRSRFSQFQENITTGSTNTLSAVRYLEASQDERKYVSTI